MSLLTRPIVGTRTVTDKAALPRRAVAVVCAGSSGVHAALVPEHLREGGPWLGGSFLLAAVVLAVTALAVSGPGHDRWSASATTAVLLGVAALYLLSRTSGVPFLMPRAESPDLLGILTTAAELSAVPAALALCSMTRKDQP